MKETIKCPPPQHFCRLCALVQDSYGMFSAVQLHLLPRDDDLHHYSHLWQGRTCLLRGIKVVQRVTRVRCGEGTLHSFFFSVCISLGVSTSRSAPFSLDQLSWICCSQTAKQAGFGFSFYSVSSDAKAHIRRDDVLRLASTSLRRAARAAAVFTCKAMLRRLSLGPCDFPG